MNRRRSSSRPVSHDERTPPRDPQPPVEDDLERAFFQEGLSEDVITAASEREQDREAIQRAIQGRGHRWVYGVAGVAAFVAGAFVVAPSFLDAHDGGAGAPLSVSAAPAPPPAPPVPPAPPAAPP